MKSTDDRIRALARRTARALAVEVKALIAEHVRAAADAIAPAPERQGDDALKVTLPNGITIHTESQGDVDALMGWLGQAPKSVLGGSEVLRRALDDESGEPPAAPSVRVPAPQPAVEKGEALPPARALRINDAESWPAELEAEMASVRLEVTKQTSDFETESGKRNKPRVAPAPNVPATLGRLALVGPTAERYHGQVVYLWRCPDCGVEARLCGQVARRRKGPTECRCAEAAVPKAAPPAEPPCAPTTSPAAASPAPAPSHDLAHPAKPPARSTRGAHGLIDAGARTLVRTMAARIATQQGASLAALVEIGNAALVHAEKTFEPSHGRAFLVWASLKVREAMLDSVRAAPAIEDDDAEEDDQDEAREEAVGE